MRNLALLLLTSSCVSGGHMAWSGGSSSSSGSSPSSSGGGGDGAPSASADEAHAKFAILGTRLGTPLEKEPGFTCGPPRGTDGFSTQNHSCVKFTDERCKERPTKIHHVRTASDLPKGQTCFMDEFAGATYLDRTFMSPTLKFIRIVGTDSNNPKIFRIEYTFAADDLTDTSNLGKALIAKYGTPTYKNAPTQMNWKAGDTELAATCRGMGGDASQRAMGEYCTIVVEDNKLDQAERARQQAADDKARLDAAPPPPPL